MATAPPTQRELHPMATALMNQLHIRRGQLGMLADRVSLFLTVLGLSPGYCGRLKFGPEEEEEITSFQPHQAD